MCLSSSALPLPHIFSLGSPAALVTGNTHPPSGNTGLRPLAEGLTEELLLKLLAGLLLLLMLLAALLLMHISSPPPFKVGSFCNTLHTFWKHRFASTRGSDRAAATQTACCTAAATTTPGVTAGPTFPAPPPPRHCFPLPCPPCNTTSFRQQHQLASSGRRPRRAAAAQASGCTTCATRL